MIRGRGVGRGKEMRLVGKGDEIRKREVESAGGLWKRVGGGREGGGREMGGGREAAERRGVV